MSTMYTDEKIAQIYDRYVSMVYKICLMMLKNPGDAEDVTQNVFVKLIKSGKEYESEKHLKASLIVIAQNECKNQLKHWWHAKRDSFDDIPEPSYHQQTADTDVISAVKSLPDKYKIPVYLFYYEGYTSEEISRMMGVNHSTVRSHLAEARKRLKLMLKEDNNE